MEPQLEPPWQHKYGYRFGYERWDELVLCFIWGITPRSYQGHWKVKLIKHDFWVFYLFQTHFGVKVSFTNDCCWHIIGRVSFHHVSQGILMPFQHLGGGGHNLLGIPLITPLSQRCSESTKLLSFSSVEHQLQPPWQNWVWKMTWVGAVLYWGTTPRSHQGHLKVTAKSNYKKTWFFWFLSIPNPFGVQVIITNDCCWHIFGRVPFHHTLQVCNFTLGGWLSPWYSPYHTHFPKLEWINTSTNM